MTTPRRLTRLPEKQAYDVAALHALLDSTYLGHVAHADGDAVTVTPTAVVRVDDRLVWHGSTGSRWMRTLAGGVPVTISVAALDAVVVARSRFESSFHYRSAVVRGTPVVVEGDEKVRALDAVVERIVPGRVAETRDSTAKEVAATLVLAVPLDDWVLKVSDGWPEDTEEDVAGDAWARGGPADDVVRLPAAGARPASRRRRPGVGAPAALSDYQGMQAICPFPWDRSHGKRQIAVGSRRAAARRHSSLR